VLRGCLAEEEVYVRSLALAPLEGCLLARNPTRDPTRSGETITAAAARRGRAV
jgi:hypothetical protein